MSLAILDGFDNRSNNPLDVKYIVADFDALATLQFMHKGMWRWVEALENIYVLQNDLETWKPLAIGSAIRHWVAGSYGLNALVIKAGGLYESQKENNTSVPGASADWSTILGQKGDPGIQGKSAYQVWLENGNTGSVAVFLNSLKGASGKSAYQLWLDAGNVGTQSDFFNSLLGPEGQRGEGLDVWDIVHAADPGYDAADLVRHDNGFWESQIDENHSVPGTDANWIQQGTGFDMTAYIEAAPICADEAAAIVAGLDPYTLYKTATGELRYKLPGTIEPEPVTPEPPTNGIVDDDADTFTFTGGEE